MVVFAVTGGIRKCNGGPRHEADVKGNSDNLGMRCNISTRTCSAVFIPLRRNSLLLSRELCSCRLTFGVQFAKVEQRSSQRSFLAIGRCYSWVTGDLDRAGHLPLLPRERGSSYLLMLFWERTSMHTFNLCP